jgi:pyruvate/2-oxoglutarate dehydrogenase complex dihydrolipoamide acyltransferase (E2) component
MATQVLVPVMGEAIGEARLATWLKHAGDAVRRGDELAELETDKAVLMLECPADGVLLETLVGEGAMVTPGQLLAHVGRAGERVQTGHTATTSRAVAPEQTEVPAQSAKEALGGTLQGTAGAKSESAAGASQRPRVSPAARRMARRLGIDIMEIVAVKAPARVTTQDVARYRDETID